MKGIYHAVTAAFSLFSALPMPQRPWGKDWARGVLCAFPLVGGAVAAAVALWLWLCARLDMGGLLPAAGATLLPILVTGGIHLDGFCDTCDALKCNRDLSYRQAVLADPHAGAFAIIGLGCYLLLTVALWSALEVDGESLTALALGYGVSRALSARAAAAFPPARGEGLLFSLAAGCGRRGRAGLGLTALALMAGQAALGGPAGLSCAAAAAGCYAYYKYRLSPRFGGVSGDLAGWFLSVCECAMLAAAVLVQKGGEWL